jgi:hypothetical protein
MDIKQMQVQLETSEAFTFEHITLTGDLIDAVVADATKAIQSGVMPVYQANKASVVAIHPSSKRPGWFQASRYSRSGVLGDSQYRTIADAVRHEGLWFVERLSYIDALNAIEQSIQAESAFQERLAA